MATNLLISFLFTVCYSLFLVTFAVMKFTLSIGSNTDQSSNVAEAKRRLRVLFPNIVFSEEHWTAPVGIVSDRFLNLLAHAETTLPAEELQETLKQIEADMGDSHANHQKGHVVIDLDLAYYNGKKMKPIIWLEQIQ